MTRHQVVLFERARQAVSTARRNLDEGDANAAVSRAYYAAYYAATAALLAKGEAPKTHQGTHQRFSLHFVADGPLDASTAGILAFAGDARQQADYDAFTVFDEAATTDLIEDVEYFVETVEAMLQNG